MNRTEAGLLVDELESLIGDQPGTNEPRLIRCREIIGQISYGQPDAYLREKASTAAEFLGIWFSPRKWQKYGSADQMRHLVLMDVAKLEMALDQHFRER